MGGGRDSGAGKFRNGGNAQWVFLRIVATTAICEYTPPYAPVCVGVCVGVGVCVCVCVYVRVCV